MSNPEINKIKGNFGYEYPKKDKIQDNYKRTIRYQ